MATIKAGTYRFNDVLSKPSAGLEQAVGFTVSPALSVDITTSSIVVSDGHSSFTGMRWSGATFVFDGHSQGALSLYSEDEGWNYGANILANAGISNAELMVGYGQTITIPYDQEASDEFKPWFTANTKRLSTITYNGATIATLNGGQTATLKCDGMKMETDLVVAVAEQTGGADSKTIIPLTVTENGVYDSYYETATEVWDSNTEYEGSVTVDGVTLSFKKAENLIVPDDLNELENEKYTAIIEGTVDGETNGVNVSFVDEIYITDGVCATYMNYAVLWVKSAAPLNAQFGISFLEDNTVYITNYAQMMITMQGASYVKLSVTAPSKKVENVAYRPVTVELPLVDMEFTPTQYGTTRKGYFKTVKVNPVPSQTLEVAPLMEDTTYEPEEGKFFSSVTVKGVDASDPSTLHQLCGIYFKVPPKTEYKVYEWMDTSNAVLAFMYTDGTIEEKTEGDGEGQLYIGDLTYDFTTYAAGTYPVTVKYTENGITSQTMFWITVTE